MHHADLQPLWKQGEQEDGQIEGVPQSTEHRGHDLSLRATGHAFNSGEEHHCLYNLRVRSTYGDFLNKPRSEKRFKFLRFLSNWHLHRKPRTAKQNVTHWDVTHNINDSIASTYNHNKWHVLISMLTSYQAKKNDMSVLSLYYEIDRRDKGRREQRGERERETSRNRKHLPLFGHWVEGS